MNDLSTTIVAPATGTQATAIGIIRLSGPKAFDILKPHFKSKHWPPKRGFQYGNFTDSQDHTVDEVVISFFPGPHSYTKQDTVEISCHGSTFIIEKIISLLCSNGAQLAAPGEFTYRAFLNGRMDLAQAEAVTDLIAASTSAQHQIAINQLKGNVSEDIKILRQKLIDFASLIELELDFGEEDVEFADRSALLILVEDTMDHISHLIQTFQLGNAIKKGVPVAIIGAPNAGKSTLLNALLKEERAIVSDIPGTTRDSIEDIININGILFRLIDTAGIRQTTDEIEAEGVNRSKQILAKAQIILYIIDVNTTTEEDVMKTQHELHLDTSKTILIANKMDTHPYYLVDDLKFQGTSLPISAKNDMNIEALKKLLFDSVHSSGHDHNATILSNIRHKEAFEQALQDLIRVKEGLHNNIPADLVAMDIRQALYNIGKITGEISADDLLGNIFSRFCIGK